MKQISFLHTSDWQIGMTRWFLSAEAQARFDAARLAAITRLGALAVEHDCAFIVVAGDVFETNSLNKQTTGRVREALAALPVPVYLLPGNHDPLTPDSIFFSSAVADGVHVIADSKPIAVADGVELVGAPLTSKHTVDDPVRLALETLEPVAPGTIRIAVGHGQVQSRSSEPAADAIDLEFVESCLADGEISYLALGDTHSAGPVGASGKVWFSGAPEVTDYLELSTGGGENNSGHALVVRVSDSHEVDVTEVQVGTWRFEAITRDINSWEDALAFIRELEAYENKSEVAIKYALRGSMDLTTMRFLETELDRLEPIFAALYARERLMDLHLDPGEEDLEAMNVTGYQADALTELIAKAQAGPEQQAASDALRLMFRLSGEGK
ncbi:exonuclease subunit SbcD [Corynebacterium kalinowskii]|uniref:Nuclease SbcCD subunit D n=1 Tax=Corynebacterium kalinowskii TaxID=2675216 RepID=A0A6B8W294_9CORY|nr:metallophosphoesterase [Corynebacterium kalinowskii]QGU01758.1 exonuclease subunit SbcD [Corynebacterium kalinowskii]